MELFLARLHDSWGLAAKPDSKLVLNANGTAVNDDADNVAGQGWQVVESCQVLGWLIQNDAGMSSQWHLLVPKLWAAFYANLRQPGWHKLGIARQFSLLTRSVESIALRTLSAWGPTPYDVDALNKLQRKMVSSLLRLLKYPGEDWK